MKKILALTIVLSILSIGVFAQRKAHKKEKREFEKAQKEMEKAIVSETDGRLMAVNPQSVDVFIEAANVSDWSTLYDMVDTDIQRFQSKEDMARIFGLYEKHYGKMLGYERNAFGVKTLSNFEQTASVGYLVEYEKYKARATGSFRIFNKDTVKMRAFNITLPDYTFVESFDSIARLTIAAIRLKDKKQVYDLTSKRFKTYISIPDFEAAMKDLFELDLSQLKMYQHELGVREGKELLTIFYELKDNKGHLQMIFTKATAIFELEGLNYTPIE